MKTTLAAVFLAALVLAGCTSTPTPLHTSCATLVHWETTGSSANITTNHALQQQMSTAPAPLAADFANWITAIKHRSTQAEAAATHRVIADCKPAGYTDVLNGGPTIHA